MERKLYCGAAKADYTPGQDMLPIRVFTPGNSRPLAAIEDHMFVRAIVFSDGEHRAALISYEMPSPPEADAPGSPVSPAVALAAQELGVPEENVMVFSTHAHSAPSVGCLDRRQNVSEDERAFDALAKVRVYEATRKALREAVRTLRPARIGVATGKSYINVNRICDYAANNREETVVSYGINHAGFSDKTLFTVRIEDMQANTIALFVNYGVHNTVMMRNHLHKNGVALSTDIAGAASRSLEQLYPGAVAVWSPAPCGDQSPLFQTDMHYPNILTGEHVREDNLDGAGILRMLSGMHTNDIINTLRGIRHFTTKADISAAVDWSVTPGRLPVLSDPSDKKSRVLGYTEENAPEYRVRMQLLRLGDIAFIGISGEPYASYGVAIKEASLLKNTCVIELCGTRDPEYIEDDERLCRTGAAAANSTIKPGFLKESMKSTTQILFEKAQ